MNSELKNRVTDMSSLIPVSIINISIFRQFLRQLFYICIACDAIRNATHVQCSFIFETNCEKVLKYM